MGGHDQVIGASPLVGDDRSAIPGKSGRMTSPAVVFRL
jgi:hypothetical protein